MAIEFTKEQQAVIDARKSNILVSAAAGSGKTAVLVERIIRMIREGLDIDHLLVVTFTKAAASQMKEKITAAISKSLLEDPDNRHLQKQETLIHNAQITTIDSFCTYVLKNNFNTIGVDPNYSIGDEGQMRLVQDEVMQELLEEEYGRAKEGNGDDFLFCMNFFSTGNSDKKVEEYIRQLYKFSMSMPWPEDWINERASDYDLKGKSFDELDFVKYCVENARRNIAEAVNKLSAAQKLCCDPDGPYMYGDNIEKEKEALENLLKYDSYDGLYDGLRTVEFKSLSSKRDTSVNPDKRELAKKIREEAKNVIKKLIDSYFVLPSEEAVEQMKYCDRAVKELCRLTLLFKKAFDEKKREKQLIDFNDMEHFALQILVDHPGEEECEGLSLEEIISKCSPSAVALEYRNYYKEVLIDEYQDSNNVQEMILKAIAGELPGESERFMVGDVKQSIYKFRLARPEIFMEKLGRYSKEEGSQERRIDLHMNFRSRKEVLEGTNYIFEKIMGSDLGDVEYDLDARLVTGATYDPPRIDVTPELIMFDADSKDSDALSDYSSREKEALVIAGRIKKLMEEDKNLRYKDIVILLRSRSGWEDVFKQVLEDQGIPAYIESKSGYFDAWEVAVMLDLLTVIDNPSQDIPLVSVMHSEIGGFSDEELSVLKIAINEAEIVTISGSLYYGLKALVDNKIRGVLFDEKLYFKLARFIDFVEELREMTFYTPVHDLILHIFEVTGFDNYCLALPGGYQRKANLDLLMNKALAFEKSSFKGLFHFVRYIENIKLVQVDYGEAGIIDENADVVRIMSIHKSKGLEFSVVFVSGMSKEFNKMDVRKELILDMDLGLGVKYIDFENRVRFDTLKRVVTADYMVADSLGEELRVLYVALTRAKEKLIMTASVKKPADKIKKLLDMIPAIAESKTLLPYSLRRNSDSYLDLVLRALARHPAFEKVLDKLALEKDIYLRNVDKNEDVPAFDIDVYSNEEIAGILLRSDLISAMNQQEAVQSFMSLDASSSEVDPELYKRLMDKFSSKYAFNMLKGLYTKTTVTELKKHLLEEMGETFSINADFVEAFEKESEAEDVPEKETALEAGEIGAVESEDVTETGTESAADRADKKKLTGADRGTAYHRVMEILDDRIYGDEAFMANPERKKVYSWMLDKCHQKIIPNEYCECVWSGDIVTFLNTKLGQRMGSAYRSGLLMREKPFMMGISANELRDSFPKEEMILIQGIIDAWFIENDEIVLVDYKTDKGVSEQQLIDRYRIQLDYYKRALEASTRKKVKEVYIYSFALGKEIILSI